MKKNVKNRLFEQQYNNVMKRLGTAVRRILESEVCDIDEDEDDVEIDECDDKEANLVDEDDLEECNESYNRISRMYRLDEMARAAVNRTVNPKSYANVRDAIARRNYDEDWASSVRPLSKFDAVELLHRYVSALLIFGKECPQTEDEIDEIGVFAKYAHKFIDEMGGTLDDIKRLYEKNDKVHNDVYEIEDISELALEDFYDPSMNASFANYKGKRIFCRGNKIGFVVKITDDERNDGRLITIFSDSFGEALEDLDVIILASITSLNSAQYELEFSSVVRQFLFAFRKVNTDELADKIEERAYDFYDNCFANAESIDDVVKGIKRMENNF